MIGYIILKVFLDDIKFKTWNKKMNSKRYRNTKNQNTERQKPSFYMQTGTKCRLI